MNKLYFSNQFNKSFSKIKDLRIKRLIWSKISQLETRAPIGKKLKNNSCWSIRVNRFRIIYEIRGFSIRIVDIIERKRGYRNI